jgi:hypothetical protein
MNYTGYLIGAGLGLLAGYLLFKKQPLANGVAGLLRGTNAAAIGSVRNYGRSYQQNQGSKALMAQLMMRKHQTGSH